MEPGEILIFISLSVGSLLVILLLVEIYISRKKVNGSEKEISLKFSNDFWKKLEGMIVEETKRTVVEIEKKILEDLINEQKRQISNFQQKLEEIAEKEKKQLLNFSQKLEEKRDGIEEFMRKETLEFVQSLIKEKGMISKEIGEIHQSLIKGKEEILKEIKTSGDRLIDELNKKISQTLDSFSESIKRKISEAETTIENYKKERLKEVDKEVYRMLISVSKKVIGRVIDISTHEKLVIEALEKAKKEGVF
jgi:G:T/U-mismatch repair DNA glycosylase